MQSIIDDQSCSPVYCRQGVTIYVGHCVDILRQLQAGSVSCVVTSPPYWGLRDYGLDPVTWINGWRGCFGLEPTVQQYVKNAVSVFAEVYRVLRDDGVLWINIADSYASQEAGRKRPGKLTCGLKKKDRCGVPERMVLALQDFGWYWRDEIIWHKPAPMPESVKDRTTASHEKVYMLTKSPRYYYDQESIKEAGVSDHGSGNGFKRDARMSYKNTDGSTRGSDKRWGDVGGKRNKRSVWTVPTSNYSKAHFATFPPKLIEPMILAGCPEGGVVLDPFLGSGSTARVAKKNGRQCIGIEANPEYIELAKGRIMEDMLF